jgi:hypothetical protein
LRRASCPSRRSEKTFASPSGLRSVFYAVEHGTGDPEPGTAEAAQTHLYLPVTE